MSGTPEWLDDKGKIIEHRYCQCFLEQQPMLSKGENFFTTEGIVTDKDRLLRDVFDDIKEHLTGGLVTKAKNLLEAIRMECYDRGELEKHQNRIFLANGTLFLDGRFVEEKGFCLNRLPIYYNPSAPQPEVWLRFLSELLEPEDILTLQEFMGYCLIPCTRGQVMLLIKGNGGEGKSRIGVVMHTLFGANAKNGSIDKVENSAFARADLQHVLVMVDDDTKMEALSSTHYVKSIITAETPMDLERKKERSFQGDMYVRFMAFSNGDLEALYDKSEGFFRRQLILQTRRKPPGRVDDPYLSDKLKQEAEGIFLWCLEGLKRLQANNYRFTVSQRAAENKEHAKRNANNLVEFFQSDGRLSAKDIIGKHFRKALIAAGKVRLLSPHCCRHTYVSQLQAQGVPLETIQSLTGHADVDMTEHYLHVQKEVKEDAAQKLNSLFKKENRPFTLREKVSSSTIQVRWLSLIIAWR